jgi:hypothetical protein
MVVLPIPPALFPLLQNRPPLYSLTLFFQNRPYALNQTTKTTPSLYNYAPKLFSNTPARFKYYN